MASTSDPRNQPALRVPAATVWLIAILVAAHLARIFAPADMADQIILNYGFTPSCYSGGSQCQTLFEKIVPFISYMFVHADFAHLAINSVWLLAFGSIVAQRLGARLFFALFFICGVAGAATHLALNWGSAVPAIGASAAISGLMGVGFRLITFEPRQAGQPAVAPLFSQRILVWSAVWVGINVLAGLTGLGTGVEVRLIAWQAHLGGYFAGLLLAGPAVAFHDRKLRAA